VQLIEPFLDGREESLRAVGSLLLPHAPALLRAWRSREPWCSLPPEVCGSLQRLLDPGMLMLAAEDPGRMREQVDYLARRLAKFKLSLEQVLTALDDFHALARVRYPRLMQPSDEGRAPVERFSHTVAALVAQTYDRVQRGALETLLGVLDAELSSRRMDELLPQLLQRVATAFSAPWAEVLLAEGGGRACLRSRARFGVPPAMPVEDRAPGPFYERLMQTRRPDVLHQSADDPEVSQMWLRAVDAKSLWAAPLGGRDHAAPLLGVLLVAFDRFYECLPQEKDLLMALAERSTLAIERTRLTESVQAKEKRVVDLSRQLLAAQEEERRRISRDLHDETGQNFMVLRLYLEMTLRHPLPAVARASLQRALDVVDGSIAGLRRIMSRLSPLVLDELGLIAALRQQLRQLRRNAGVAYRFRATPVQISLSRELEALIFRVVQEGLSNIARHSQARHVVLSIRQSRTGITVRLEDDGRGLPADVAHGGRFGLAGMRERLRLVGGSLTVVSAPGQGTRLHMEIPLPAEPASSRSE
jgi:signal transduction histidine kinase